MHVAPASTQKTTTSEPQKTVINDISGTQNQHFLGYYARMNNV
jgi:hypothetical protein